MSFDLLKSSFVSEIGSYPHKRNPRMLFWRHRLPSTRVLKEVRPSEIILGNATNAMMLAYFWSLFKGLPDVETRRKPTRSNKQPTIPTTNQNTPTHAYISEFEIMQTY